MSFRKKLVKTNFKMAVIPLVALLSLLMIVVGVYRHLYQDSHFQGSVFHDEDSFFYAVLAVIAFVVILIIISCTLYANRMAEQLMVPIRKLSEGAERIAEGDLTNKILYEGEDEFAVVCESFNEMQDRLSENIQKNIQLQQKKQEMIAGISHDLKTPLTAVKGYVRGIIDGVANTEEKKQRYLNQIEAKADEIERLIDELFLYSKLETKKITYQFEQYEINQYAREYFEAIKDEYEEMGIQLKLETSKQEAFTMLDTNHMNRVLHNIIINAIKYNQEIKLCIIIQVIVENSKILLKVSDNGTGVVKEKLPYIFESFYRGDESRKNPENGSGLGLAIVKTIVEAHHGEVKARNENGLVIEIELPKIG